MLAGALIYGLVNAAVLTLYALGFNLTFGISGIANFAYGALYVLTGYAAWSGINSLKLPTLLALPAAILLTALLAGGLYRLILIRLRGLAESEVIATFALGLVILEVLRSLGFTGFQFSLPVWWEGNFFLGSVSLDRQRVLIVIFGVILTGGLWVFTHHTRLGLTLRGLAQDERTALCLGLEPDFAATVSMALGGGLCGIASVVILPIGNIVVDAGYEVLLQALAVSIVGGLGSAGGVIVAGLALGLSQTLAAMYLGPHWMMIVTLAAILIILIFKPSGLFARQKEIEERA